MMSVSGAQRSVLPLADIARQLRQISETLEAYAAENPPEPEHLKASQGALADLARQLEEHATGQAAGPADSEALRLRKAILENLRRNGPALFPELAAATLSLPDEIRPVVQAMEQEGLVEIQTVRGWQRVALTARGRQEAGRV